MSNLVKYKYVLQEKHKYLLGYLCKITSIKDVYILSHNESDNLESDILKTHNESDNLKTHNESDNLKSHNESDNLKTHNESDNTEFKKFINTKIIFVQSIPENFNNTNSEIHKVLYLEHNANDLNLLRNNVEIFTDSHMNIQLLSVYLPKHEIKHIKEIVNYRETKQYNKHAEEIMTLKRLFSLFENKKYDFVYFGNISPKINSQLNILKRTFKICVLEGKDYNEAIICQATCILNLQEDFQSVYTPVFSEAKYCKYISANIPIISETCLHNKTLHGVLFTPINLDSSNINTELNKQLSISTKSLETLRTYSDMETDLSFHINSVRNEIYPGIFCFWTGDNPLTENRIKCLKNMECIQLPVILITKDNLSDWILPDYPIHPAYEYLCLTHKADYLRCYFMHHYGGGYADIKMQFGSWLPYFHKLKNSSNIAIGYRELNDGISGVPDKTLYWKMRSVHKDMIGNGSYIMKRRTILTTEWYEQLHILLNDKLELLRKNPSDKAVDHSGISDYPLRWTEILGDIFHPLAYKYKSLIFNDLYMPLLQDYR